MIASSEVRLSSTRLPTPQNKSTVHHNQRPPTPGREPWGGWALTNEALALSRPWRPDRTLSWLSQQCSGPLPITPHWGPTLLARCWARPPWPSTTRGRQGADFQAPPRTPSSRQTVSSTAGSDIGGILLRAHRSSPIAPSSTWQPSSSSSSPSARMPPSIHHAFFAEIRSPSHLKISAELTFITAALALGLAARHHLHHTTSPAS